MKTKLEKFFTRLALTAVVVLLSPINAMASPVDMPLAGVVEPVITLDSFLKNGLPFLAIILLPITVIVVLVIVFVRQAKKAKNKVSSKKKK